MSTPGNNFTAAIQFDHQGLVPVIAQDRETGVVRMFAFANAEALQTTFATGRATFWSRSRRKLWCKGEESGNVLHVAEIRLDCDGDAVLYLCDPVGPTCHTGQTSCFFRVGDELQDDGGPHEIPAAILSRLGHVIHERRQRTAEKSYVASLLAKGLPKINAKISEEAGEITEALLEGDPEHIAHEAADVIFHVMVGLEATGIPIDNVFTELRRRFDTSGHVEKANRPPKNE